MSATTKIWSNGVPPTCEDDDLNGFKNENNNLIIGSGQALSTADNQQTHKAIAHYAATGDFYVDSGAADAYVLSVTGVQVAPPTYATGMRIRFEAGNSNTGASTVNVAGLGVKNIKNSDGSVLFAEAILANVPSEAYYDGVDFRLVNDMGRVLIETLTASGSAFITFSNFFAVFQKYEIEVIKAIPVTDAVDLLIQAEALAAWGIPTNLALTISNITGNSGVCGQLNMYSPTTSDLSPIISRMTDAGTIHDTGIAAGSTTAATTGLRFFMSSGNIASGVFKLYGIR